LDIAQNAQKYPSANKSNKSIHCKPLAKKVLRQRSVQNSNDIEDFLGLLAGKSRKVATLKEINEATAAGWAGQVK